jgi:hypothetical protein
MKELETTSEWNLVDGMAKREPAKDIEGDSGTPRIRLPERSADGSEAVNEAVRKAYQACCGG